MYEWVWQRQSQILLGDDSGEYCQPFDLIRGKGSPGTNSAETKGAILVRRRRNSTGQVLEEDSSGYLLPAQAVDRNRIKSSEWQESPRRGTNHAVQNGSGRSDTVDSVEYSYARLMTTTTKPVQAQRGSPKLQRRPEPPPKPVGPPGRRGSALLETHRKENLSDDVLKAAAADSDDDASPR